MMTTSPRAQSGCSFFGTCSFLFVYAACLYVAKGSGAEGVCASGSGACGNTLLQKASRLHQSSSSTSEAACPSDGQQCTIIAVPKDSQSIESKAYEVAASYEDKAKVSRLAAIGDIILDFGKNKAKECCLAYKVLRSTVGIDIVEFDTPVHALLNPTHHGGLTPLRGDHDSEKTQNDGSSTKGHDGEKTKSKESSAAESLGKVGSSCPDDGAECILIVVLDHGAHATKVVEPYKDFAKISQLKAVSQSVLEFGKHQPEVCCDAYKTLQRRTGVKSVEFNQQIPAWVKETLNISGETHNSTVNWHEKPQKGKEESGARTFTGLGAVLTCVAAWALNRL